MIKKLLKIPLFIFSFILWIHWWITAVIILDLMILISFITPKIFHNFLVKIFCKALMYCVFIFPKHKGLNPKDIPYPVIFVANHVSFFDLFISGSIL